MLKKSRLCAHRHTHTHKSAPKNVIFVSETLGSLLVILVILTKRKDCVYVCVSVYVCMNNVSLQYTKFHTKFLFKVTCVPRCVCRWVCVKRFAVPPDTFYINTHTHTHTQVQETFSAPFELAATRRVEGFSDELARSRYE